MSGRLCQSLRMPTPLMLEACLLPMHVYAAEPVTMTPRPMACSC